MGNKNVKLSFSGKDHFLITILYRSITSLISNFKILYYLFFTCKSYIFTIAALDEVTSDESNGYLVKSFKANVIGALDKIEEQIMSNSEQAENLLISSCTMFMMMVLYLVTMGLVISSLNKAKSEIRELKVSKNEVSSSNLNYLNLSRGSPGSLKGIKIRREAKGTDPETGMIRSF